MGQSGGESSTSPGRRGIWRRLQPWLLGLLTILASLVWACERASRHKSLVLTPPAWTGWSECEASQGRIRLRRERVYPDRLHLLQHHSQAAVRARWDTPIFFYIHTDLMDSNSGQCIADMRLINVKLLPLAALFAAWPAMWLLFRAFRGRRESARGFEVLHP